MFITFMALDEVPLIVIRDGAAECVEQDQSAHTCSLILLYTLRKINPLSRSVGPI